LVARTSVKSAGCWPAWLVIKLCPALRSLYVLAVAQSSLCHHAALRVSRPPALRAHPSWRPLWATLPSATLFSRQTN
jgi:hypothetical protein